MSRARHRFLDELAERFASHGAEPYGEAVSQAEHALQCATLAEARRLLGQPVVAALLHDIGHLYEDPAQIDEGGPAPRNSAHCRCATVPESVWQPVRLHVSAKRFLRGGPELPRQPVAGLPAQPGAARRAVRRASPPRPTSRRPMPQDGLTLRRLDDLARDPAMRTPN